VEKGVENFPHPIEKRERRLKNEGKREEKNTERNIQRLSKILLNLLKEPPK
jgi:hypothetical protein